MSNSPWSSASPPPQSDRQQQNGAHNFALRKLMPASEDRELVTIATSSRSAPIINTAVPTAGLVVARKKRRQATPAACGACRKRKSKCNGERPLCSFCRDRKTSCVYETNETETHTQALKRKYSELQSSKTAFEQVYTALQTRSREEAEAILDRIRRGADAHAVLRHVEHGDVLVQLSLVPEARFRYEFPYIPDMPQYLQHHHNPYLDSEVYEYALRSKPALPQQQALPSIADLMDPANSRDQRDPYYKPYSSARVVHRLLESVKPSKWTLVSSDDVLMRKIMHDYFLYDYDWFSAIHIDLFLQDMADERPRFCSSLLVNAVLCLGCLSHQGLHGRSEFWNPRNLGSQFLAEAKRLFDMEIEDERPLKYPEDLEWEHKLADWEYRRLTSIQAALLLNITHVLHGQDKIGWRLTVRAVEMADEIGLFREPSQDMDQHLRCIRAVTAWALFMWQSLNCYHYLRPPLLKEPPRASLPDPAKYPDFYGELWVKYPLASSCLPIYHGLLFKAKAGFWTILNEFSLLAFSASGPLNMPQPQIVEFYLRLHAWLHNLPEELSAKKIVFPSQLKIHMHYNHVITDLLKPVLGQNWSDQGSPPKSLDQTHTEAILNLETLVRIFYLRHGFESPDSFLIHFLGNLGFIARASIEVEVDGRLVESYRSTIALCMKGMHELSRSYFVARAVLRLQASHLRPEEVELVKRIVNVESEQLVHGPLEHTLHSDWPVYEIGYEARVEQRRQGKDFGTVINMVSSSSERSISPVSSRSPTYSNV